MNRRGFLIGAAAGVLGSTSSWGQEAEGGDEAPSRIEEIKAAAAAHTAHENRLWIMRESGEDFDSHLLFRKDAASEAALLLFSHLWRDVRDKNQAVWIDARLLFMLAEIQTKIALTKKEWKPLMLTSGYRTPERNSTLEGAAVHSLHMYGKAADIRVEGVSIEDLTSIIADMDHQGGLGKYSRFVHVDTGKKRNWSG